MSLGRAAAVAHQGFAHPGLLHAFIVPRPTPWRFAVASGEATGTEERTEHPFGRDGAAVAELKDLVGGDTTIEVRTSRRAVAGATS